MKVRALFITAAGSAMVVCSAVSAQVQPYQGQKPRYYGVEQMVEDVSPLGVSLRSLQGGLQQPGGFEGVYRVPGEGDGTGRLMRIDGALAATFPRSAYAGIYIRDRRVGDVPVVPPDTVFRIGLPTEPPTIPPNAQPSVRTPVPSLAVSPRSVALRADEGHGMRRPAPAVRINAQPAMASDEAVAAASSLLGDEREREQRMRAKLQRALEAERSSQR